MAGIKHFPLDPPAGGGTPSVKRCEIDRHCQQLLCLCTGLIMLQARKDNDLFLKYVLSFWLVNLARFPVDHFSGEGYEYQKGLLGGGLLLT